GATDGALYGWRIVGGTRPTEAQAGMPRGKRILVGAHRDAAELVRRAQCGVEATPEDATAIARAASRLGSCSRDELASMGRRAKTFYDDHLSMAVGADRFGRLFETVTHAKHG